MSQRKEKNTNFVLKKTQKLHNITIYGKYKSYYAGAPFENSPDPSELPIPWALLKTGEEKKTKKKDRR